MPKLPQNKPAPAQEFEPIGDRATTTMTRYEGERLERLCRDRERIAKAAVDARAAEIWAHFQQQLCARYDFDQDQVWKASYQRAEMIVAQAQRDIAAESKKLGILPEFAPSLILGWRDSGQNACKERRRELEKLGRAELDARTKKAKGIISLAAAEVRVKLLDGLLESDQAKAFLESMPTAADLLPQINYKELEDAILAPQRHFGLVTDATDEGSDE
jgi:hypothetical protein